MKHKKQETFTGFEGSDRFGFPEPVKRVTAGHGGEALLIIGSEKTALYDCGMAYCWKDMLENLEDILKDRPLDYVLASHTHYDHIGALPYIRDRYPKVVVVGAEYAAEVFQRPGALRVMRELGEDALKEYSNEKTEIKTDGMSIDRIVADGDIIELGDRYLRVIETPGHTDCSLTFVLEPDNIMFSSESTGVLLTPEFVHTPILKSYEDCMESAEKCAAENPKLLIVPHFGILPEDFNEKYWQLFMENANEKYEFLRGLYNEGISEEEILERYAHHYREEIRADEQPKGAYMINAANIVRTILRQFK